MSLIDDLTQLRTEALAAFAAASAAKALEHARIKFIGANGRAKALLGQVGKAPPDIKPQAGKLANQIKNELQLAFDTAKDARAASSTAPTSEFDISEPLPPEQRRVLGRRHPMTRTVDSLLDIFHAL